MDISRYARKLGCLGPALGEGSVAQAVERKEGTFSRKKEGPKKSSEACGEVLILPQLIVYQQHLSPPRVHGLIVASKLYLCGSNTLGLS